MAIADITAQLPDPHRYAEGGQHPLLELAAASGAEAERKLVEAMRELLARRADTDVRRALALAPGRETYLRLWQALCTACDIADGRPDAVVTRIFAMPLVIVAGARQGASLPGILPDVKALADVLERAGALGASRNLGFSNALCSLEALAGVPPSTLCEWSVPDAAGGWPRAIPPEPIAIRAGEEAHLRFLLGAAITPAAAPSVAETAAHIGAWGLPFARALGAQIAVPGVELLALPRPPSGVLKAAVNGRRAQLEVALNLFMSNTIKRVRATAGDPALVISVHQTGKQGAELRVSMSAPFDDTLLEGFRWPLHPLDEPNEIARGIRQLATDCRLTDVRIVETVLPEGGGSEPLFVRAGEVAPPSAAARSR